ncbi:MAG: hypothetical protein K9G60_06465 [Pseudolabrys sp.]|nr:hypothetical protein [Pseudolabrys sp.]
MTDLERVKSLMDLANFRFERWKERRSYEWKMSLAFWTALAVAVGYVAVHKVAISQRELVWVAPVLVVAVAGHAWFWVRTNWISAEMDIRTAFYFAEHAENILLPKDPVEIKKRLDPDEFERSHRCFEFLERGVCKAQVFASVFLAGVLFFVLLLR